jgi:hypothetical protein
MEISAQTNWITHICLNVTFLWVPNTNCFECCTSSWNRVNLIPKKSKENNFKPCEKCLICWNIVCCNMKMQKTMM